MKSKFWIFTIILLIGCLSQMGSDIYSPSVPAIAQALHTHLGLVQWTMAIYMLGVALSLLFYGPLSDSIGRKKPLIIGLSLVLLGNVICLLSRNINTLLIGRFVQGCGAGACAGLWRAIFRDVFKDSIHKPHFSRL